MALTKAQRADIERCEALRADPECESVRRLIEALSAHAKRCNHPSQYTLNKLWWLMEKPGVMP